MSFLFPGLAILGEKRLTCSMAFHGTDCCVWLMAPQAQSCLCFCFLGKWMQRC